MNDIPSNMEGKVEGEDAEASPGSERYELKSAKLKAEDIIFCVDCSSESTVEIRAAGGSSTRLDAIKHSILLFINCKLSINSEHRFAFASLSNSVSWIKKDFSNKVDAAVTTLSLFPATSSCDHADLVSLFRLASHAAKKSRAQDRILRVILIYCRSSMRPQHQLVLNQKLFTLDVIYLHDKPGPDNCPQLIYDDLGDAVEGLSEYEGFIFENGPGNRQLFRNMSMLLSHPQQRLPIDRMTIPKPLIKKASSSDPTNGEEPPPVSKR